ncbi:hypothetical protein [Streptomyces hebeiensis]|uniref:hypothetical protein n=1 Tax=Streptomyces hebeiensis TaxID=229486 RepID=UPI0031DDBB3A
MTFFDSGTRFEGTAQFPDEGPVGYRGSLANRPPPECRRSMGSPPRRHGATPSA